MCGLAGFVGHSLVLERRRRVLQAMTDSLAHRGPDDAGLWVDGTAGVAFGHRRLAIIDLSNAGHQPMFSASGRTAIVFNGEIYNFAELRSHLERAGIALRGHSDTEVLLEAIELLGIEEALSRSRGMFALAVWDRTERVLHLARDRFGEKPLYLGMAGKDLVFGSEVRAIVAHPCFSQRIDSSAAIEYVRYGHVPSPRSVFADARKLPAGTILSVPFDGEACPFGLDALLQRAKPYWKLEDLVISSRSAVEVLSEEVMVRRIEAVLVDAVREQLVSDVPIGAFLSGGIDSTLISALMSSVSAEPIRTFTIGFADERYDESEAAASVARHLGTRHTAIQVSPKDALDLIPNLSAIYDEPFADSSQIPTVLVCRMARRNVAVALSGDGGDESFGGYNRHVHAPRLWGRVSAMPLWIREALSAAIASGSAGTWANVFRFFDRFLPGQVRHRLPAEKLFKFATMLRARDPVDLYRLLTQLSGAASILDAQFAGATAPLPNSRSFARRELSLSEQMMLADSLGYMSDDILVKVDRAAMSSSLETRAPFLDERVVRAAWQLPEDMKIRGVKGKYVLRKVLEKYVPSSLTDRPKLGFGVPIDEWLRGPLREWASELLSRSALQDCAFLSVDATRKAFDEHVAGKRDWHHVLWAVLMWQSWMMQPRKAHE